MAAAATVALITAACGTPPPPTITVGGDTGLRGASAAEMMWTPLEFVLADSVDLPAGEKDAWRWDTPDTIDVTQLAATLGVPGDVTGIADSEGGGWQVGGSDDAATLTVSPGGSWWASQIEHGDVAISSPCGEPERSPDGNMAVVCDEPVMPPPADLPTDDEVLATAATIFGNDATLTVVWRDDWSVTVEAETTVDGRPSGHRGSFGVSGYGWNAAGLLATPRREGPYPTLSASQAVDRLSGSPLGFARSVNPTGVVAIDEPVVTTLEGVDDTATSGAVASEQGMTEPGLIEPGVIEPGVIEPGVIDTDMPDPDMMSPDIMDFDALGPDVIEPAEIILTGVTETLVAFYDAAGIAWSLPGYLYTDTDEGTWEAVAVSDDYLDVSSSDPDGNDATPPGGITPPGVIGGEPGTGDGSDGSPGGDSSGDADDGFEPFPGDVSLPDVTGLTEAEAVGVLTDAGFTIRVIERDGEMFPMTMDYRSDRANLVITQGVVVTATIG